MIAAGARDTVPEPRDVRDVCARVEDALGRLGTGQDGPAST